MIKFDIDEVREYIERSSAESKVYNGADSEKFKKNGKWYVVYTTAVVIHIDGCRGGKIFGRVDTELDYDQKKNRPMLRMMNEAYRAAGMYLDLFESIGDRECEVHLDINPDEKHGSSCALNQAVGYIMGTCGIRPKVKPEAFAASYCADRLQEVLAA